MSRPSLSKLKVARLVAGAAQSGAGLQGGMRGEEGGEGAGGEGGGSRGQPVEHKSPSAPRANYIPPLHN